jgi:hypothetical protein
MLALALRAPFACLCRARHGRQGLAHNGLRLATGLLSGWWMMLD